MTERQADQKWVEDTRALYEARASREARLEDMGQRTGWFMAEDGEGLTLVGEINRVLGSIARERSERLESWCCLRASVGPDGAVSRIDGNPMPGWANRGP